MNIKKDCYIFDLDGTLADISIRREIAINEKTDNQKKFNWKRFFDPELIINDFPNKNVIDFFKHLVLKDKTIFIVTGRSENLNLVTCQWFAKYSIHGYEEMFMRKYGDHREDTIVKDEIYREKIQPYYNVVLAVDDRNSIVNLWRSLGIECWQVADGNF